MNENELKGAQMAIGAGKAAVGCLDGAEHGFSSLLSCWRYLVDC